MPVHSQSLPQETPRSRILASAEGAYYTSAEGKRLFDCHLGHVVLPARHGHPKIAEAVARQVKELDYSPRPDGASEDLFAAERIVRLAPREWARSFFANSGSERWTPRSRSRSRITAEGPMRAHAPDRPLSAAITRGHRRDFGRRHRAQPQDVRAAPPIGRRSPAAHLQRREMGVFRAAQPKWGAHLADELERLVALHDASTIAAVIVEPMQGSPA